MEPIAQQFHLDKNRVSVTDWLISIFVASIPLIGMIMLFIWAFSNEVPETKANWAKAMLLLALIFIMLGVIFTVIFGSLFFWNQPYVL
jgi:hypothetical protein